MTSKRVLGIYKGLRISEDTSDRKIRSIKYQVKSVPFIDSVNEVEGVNGTVYINEPVELVERHDAGFVIRRCDPLGQFVTHPYTKNNFLTFVLKEFDIMVSECITIC